MITVHLNLPTLVEVELNSIATAQRTDIESVIMGALAQCFNKPQLLTALGFVCRPLSVAAKA